MEDTIEEIKLTDFLEVYDTSIDMQDGRHLWDWLNHNGYIKVEGG